MSGIFGLSYMDILIIILAVLAALRWSYRILQGRKDRKEKTRQNTH